MNNIFQMENSRKRANMKNLDNEDYWNYSQNIFWIDGSGISINSELLEFEAHVFAKRDWLFSDISAWLVVD